MNSTRDAHNFQNLFKHPLLAEMTILLKRGYVTVADRSTQSVIYIWNQFLQTAKRSFSTEGSMQTSVALVPDSITTYL